MALRIYGTFEPDGTFPAVKAEDVEMPDGSRLSEFAGSGGSVTIDPTFTIAGAAAEAKAVGDAMAIAYAAFEQITGDIGKLKRSPTSVDLSAFETQGLIVETYADGSEITYQMEFDSEGRPIKVTDSNGNETVLTW